MGFYWLYFSSQKWFDNSWVKPILEHAAASNPNPAYTALLTNLVIPNWLIITQIQTITEAMIGSLLLIGFLTRIAGTLGAILTINLAVCFLGLLNEPALVWFYVLSASSSMTVAVSDAGRIFGIDGMLTNKLHSAPS